MSAKYPRADDTNMDSVVLPRGVGAPPDMKRTPISTAVDISSSIYSPVERKFVSFEQQKFNSPFTLSAENVATI